MLNEESCELSLNLFGNNIIDIEKEDTQNVYEIRYNENINKSNKKFVKRKTFKVYKNIIFNIEKVLKLGRIKKGSNKKRKHNKFQKDKIIRKFKVLLMKNIFIFFFMILLLKRVYYLFNYFPLQIILELEVHYP